MNRDEKRNYMLRYRKAHRTELAARAHDRYRAFKQKRLKYMHQYAAAHNDEIKMRQAKYRATHREEQKEKTRKWRAEHPEEKKAYAREYYLAHREEYKLRRKKSNSDHPGQNAIKMIRRRVRQYRGGGSHTAEEWQMLLDLYGNKCLACGRTDVELTQDHVIPLKLGGSDFISNIQPLCRQGNCAKHATIKDYRPVKYSDIT